MSTITVAGGVTFHYLDSGLIHTDEYATIIITVHCHSFHSGIFRRILPLAKPYGVRIICVSRRPYNGSTPYTPEEIEIMENGSEEQRTTFLHKQGVLLALFMDAIIQRHTLPEASGIALVGWSMGNIFTMAILAAIHDLPSDTKEKLRNYLRSYVCWDAPSSALGISVPDGSYNPFLDPSIALQDRGAAFGLWVSGYFEHGDHLSEKLFSAQPAKYVPRSTLSGMEFDTPIIMSEASQTVLRKQTSQALFDSEIRKEWGPLNVCLMYGENTGWHIVYAMWELKKKALQAGIGFEFITDANHFMMWDDPERFMNCLQRSISKSWT